MNLVDLYNKNTVYIDDIKPGDIVTVLSSIFDKSGQEVGKKYKVVKLNGHGSCIQCSNYGVCMTVTETGFKLMRSTYDGVACHFVLGDKNGVRFKKR